MYFTVQLCTRKYSQTLRKGPLYLLPSPPTSFVDKCILNGRSGSINVKREAPLRAKVKRTRDTFEKSYDSVANPA